MRNAPFYLQSRLRAGISRPTVILGSCLWLAVIVALAFVWQSRPENAPAAAQTETTQTPIRPGENKSSVKLSLPERHLPDFEFEDCTGGTFGLSDLKGKRWVASFIFTSCVETCPTITRAMMEVHDQVEQSAPDVMFISFTVYPIVDTADVLKNYSETFTKGNWDRWKFLTGSQQKLFEVIVDGFGQFVKENPNASQRPGFEVAHANRVVLVNEEGIPVGTFLATRPEDMVKLRRILTGKDDFPVPAPPGTGLSFSNADGSPVDVQFELKPAGDGAAQPETLEAGQLNSDDDSVAAKPRSAVEHNRSIDERMPPWARMLPTVNSGLNTLSAILLMMGLIAIKTGKRQTHRNLMITAFLTSAVFLACYLTYHYALGKYTGEHGKKFPGDGVAAIVYQLILWPHIVLAVFVPFLAVRVFMHAFAERWDAHKKLAKITFPIWMFVSVTGVVIYGMLYHWPWPMAVS
jgi:protein SCO1/2